MFWRLPSSVDIGRNGVVFLSVMFWCISQCRCMSFSESGGIFHVDKIDNTGCRGNLTATANRETLTSTNFPENYPPNENCRWVITASNGNIKLFLKSLETEESPVCKYDYLEIFAGSSLDNLDVVAKYCGRVDNQSISTDAPVAVVVFKSDISYEKKGFELQYFTDKSLQCNSTITTKEGDITSPNYPSFYPKNISCWTLITVDPGYILDMEFKDISLEFHHDCVYDFVEIYDGATTESNSFGRFCGESHKEALQSTTNEVLIHFSSDVYASRRGFHLEYKSKPSGIQVSSEGGCIVKQEKNRGTIITPSYPDRYPSNTRCTVILNAPLDHGILLKFEDFSLEPDRNCSFDYVDIWDFDDKGWHFVRRLCDYKTSMNPVSSTDNRLMLQFFSNSFFEYRGFNATFSSVAKGLSQLQAVDPYELFDEIPKNITLSPGGNQLIRCTSKMPEAKIFWKKEEMDLMGRMPLPGLHLIDETTLWIEIMSDELAGRYMCTAATKDEKASVSIFINISEWEDDYNDGEACIAYSTRSPLQLTEGDEAILECNNNVFVEDSDNIRVTWLKNKEEFKDSARFYQTSNGSLWVRYSEPEDNGLYTCIVLNTQNNCSKELDFILRVLPLQEVCGRPSVLPNGTETNRATSGEAQKDAFPWQVVFWNPNLHLPFCGGSLLNNQWVLTAAHCFKNVDINSTEVLLGKYDLLETEPNEVRTRITKLRKHPRFEDGTFENDVALIKLANPVKFSDSVKPICLGEESFIEREFFNHDHYPGVVSGWGKDSRDGHLPRYPKEILLTVQDQEVCKKATEYLVTKEMFCAGNEQNSTIDTCKGDSGNSFVVKFKNVWYVAGIVSWGDGCGQPGQYGYYIKVSAYHSWIKRILSIRLL